MAEAAVDERPNKVKIEDAGPCLKKILIEVPKETVDEQLADSMSTAAVEASLPGFRKGRVPRKLLEKRFGGAVRAETKQQLVASAYQSAVEDNELRIVGEPTSEMLKDVELEAGKPLKFEIEVEVPPSFELPELEGMKIIRPLLEVTDEMVGEELERVCVQEGDLQERDKPEAGDYLTGRAVMTSGKEEFYDIPDAVVRVPPKDKDGKGMILGVAVDDFAKQLGLPKAGDTVKVKVTGPDNHEREELRGKKLQVEFTPNRVDRIVPADADELAKNKFGMEGADELRERIKSQLEHRVRGRQQQAMRAQISKHLLDAVDMELPERLNAAQAARNLERARLALLERGTEAGEIEERLAELRGASSERTQRELKLVFLMDRVAEDQEVQVSEQELNAWIVQLAMQRGERPDVLRQQLIQTGQINSAFQQVREAKAMDAVLDKAEIEDMDADEYNKKIGELAEA